MDSLDNHVNFARNKDSDMVGEYLLLISSSTLAVFLGAQITEAVLFVPYWKELSPDEFFSLHRTYGRKIYQFFAPLTIAATIIPLITVGYHFIFLSDCQSLLTLLAFSTLAFFATYFLYFKKANQSFAERSLSDLDLPGELKEWSMWHWGRVILESIALLSSITLQL